LLAARAERAVGGGLFHRGRRHLAAPVAVFERAGLAKLTEVSPRAAAAFFESLVLIFIERLRASGDLVAEVTRWGLEATGLDVETR
jgi:hypothetical protein